MAKQIKQGETRYFRNFPWIRLGTLPQYHQDYHLMKMTIFEQGVRKTLFKREREF